MFRIGGIWDVVYYFVFFIKVEKLLIKYENRFLGAIFWDFDLEFLGKGS